MDGVHFVLISISTLLKLLDLDRQNGFLLWLMPAKLYRGGNKW
jgi:hypothetical protein